MARSHEVGVISAVLMSEAELAKRKTTLEETIILGLEERRERTKELARTSLCDATEQLSHDLKICDEGIAFFKIARGTIADPDYDTLEMKKQFKVKKFSEAFDYWFRILDSSEEGYLKDFNLRQKVGEWLEIFLTINKGEKERSS